MTADVSTRANDWIAGDDTGLSSRAIWAHMMGVKGKRYWDHPYDPDDLGRCLRLLATIPEWRPRIYEMAKRSKAWKSLCENWDSIEKTMVEEVGIDWSKAQSAPVTYNLMKTVLGHRA